jgi:hypothetical protein
MSTARRIYGSTIACVLLAFAMTSAATARALQDHRSPDARDAAQTPGMSETTSPAAAGPASPDARDAATDPGTFNAPRRDLAKSSPTGSVRSWNASSTRRHRSGRAPRGRDGRQTAAAHARPLQPRHRLGRRRHRRRKPARRDRPRVCGRHDDPAAQAPQTPNGDCPLTARAQHRRERGAGMRGPPPDPGREAARRRSRRKAQATNQSASRLLRTNGSSARPSPAGCCFVCDCARVHDTARASQPPRQGPSARSRSASVSSTVPL